METKTDFVKRFHAAQERYVYFMLAAAGSAIAVAVQQTLTAKADRVAIPLGIAVTLWAISFYAGIKNRDCSQAAIWDDVHLIMAKEGTHPGLADLAKEFPDPQAAAIVFTQQSRDKVSNTAGFWARTQDRCFYAGAVFYLAWHVLGMFDRAGQLPAWFAA